MEMEAQFSNPSSPYVTAPSSPNNYDTSTKHYYPSSNFDDFEFEMSKTNLNFESLICDDDPRHQTTQKHRERGDSIPVMAFADELFIDGLVVPLKLPPRLQIESDFDTFSQMSPVLSPKSPRGTMFKIPFARKSAWNDDFDPFMMALEKVMDEKRGNISHEKFSFEVMSNQDQICKENIPVNKPMQQQVLRPSYSGPLELKGTVYARWVRDQTKEGGFIEKGSESSRGFLFGQRVKPLKIEQDCLNKPKFVKESIRNGNEESKVQKLKEILLKYASLGRHGNQMKKSSEVQKPSSISKLSSKGNGDGNGKKSVSTADRKMSMVEYKPSLALCLGYGVGSPKIMK